MFKLLGITLLLSLVNAHGRMITPMTRVGHTRYEGDPVGFGTAATPNKGNTLTEWICRHEDALEPSTTWKAGDSVDLSFNWGVNHVGFCDGMISYDWDKPRTEMAWFKIANWLECGSSPTLSLTVPHFLPSGRAVFRWSWTALHLYPNTEVFCQCADIMINGAADSAADLGIKTFSIINPQLYPQTGKKADEIQGATYADPFGMGEKDRIVGPACALGYTGNNCQLSAPGTAGHINPHGDAIPTTASDGTSTTTRSSTSTTQSIGGECKSTASHIPDSWCVSNCKVDKAYCLSSGFCECSIATTSTTSTSSSTASTTASTSASTASTTASTSASTASSTASAGGEEVRLCYFTNWARYRSGLVNVGKDVFEMDFDATLCTHVNYGFGTIDKTTYGLKSFDPNADHPSGDPAQTTLCPAECVPGYKHDWSTGSKNPCEWPCTPDRAFRGYEGLNVWAKKKNPKLKSLLSVGGWNFNDCSYTQQAGQGRESCEIFSTIAGSEDLSRKHAIEVIDFLRNWGFDGYDIDWEYPVVAGHNDLTLKATPQDFKNYIRLLQILREEFEAEALRTSRPRLLLTAAVGVGKSTVEQAYDIPNMAKALDLIGLMTYDLHGGWEHVTGFHTALYATEEDVEKYGYPVSVSWAADYWLDHGASPGQLLLGAATYGRGWQLGDASCSSALCPTSGKAKAGISTKEAGFLAFYEVEDMLNRGVATRKFDDARKVPYIVTDDGQWIGYEDAESTKIKMDYLKSKGLRGTIVWAIDLDNLNTFELLKTIKSELAGHVSGPTTPAPSSTSTTSRAISSTTTSSQSISSTPSSTTSRSISSTPSSTTSRSISTSSTTQTTTFTTTRLVCLSKKYISISEGITDADCTWLCGKDEGACFATGQCRCKGSAVTDSSTTLATASVLVFLALLF